jgi:hypothetical protein
MIFKSILIGFLLQHKNLIKNQKYRQYSTLSGRIEEQIEKNNNTITLADLFKGSFKQSNGMDERYNLTETVNYELIYNISRFFKAQKLIQTLENKDVSIHTKLDYIKEYDFEINSSITAPNLAAGGLWDEWTKNG